MNLFSVICDKLVTGTVSIFTGPPWVVLADWQLIIFPRVSSWVGWSSPSVHTIYVSKSVTHFADIFKFILMHENFDTTFTEICSSGFNWFR